MILTIGFRIKKNENSIYRTAVNVHLRRFFDKIQLYIMRNILFVVLSVLFFSCNSGIENHRKAIEELSKNWITSDSLLAEYSIQLSNEIASFSESAGSMTLDTLKLGGYDKGKVTAYNAAIAACKTALNAYDPLNEELSDFIIMWQEKATGVTTLTDGLAAGEMEGDVAGQIAELSGLITQAGEKIAAWSAKQSELKTAADSAIGALRSSYAEIQKK